MKLHASLLSLISLVALPLASIAVQPAGGTTTPTIGFGGTAIPGGAQATTFVISTSGSYYLAGDRIMTADVNAITVSAPDVTIDLNGCTVSFSGGAAANGIEIPAVSNVEIRNGSINDVPRDAIKALGGSGLRIIDVRVTTAGKNGVYSTAAMTSVDRSDISLCGNIGVYVLSAPSAKVTNSRVFKCNQGFVLALVPNGEISNCHARENQQSGIWTNDSGCLISNNVVSQNNLSKLVNEGGIIITWGQSTVRGNVVTGNHSKGIVANFSSVIEGNSISGTDSAGQVVGAAINGHYSNPSLYVNNRIHGGAVSAGLVNGGGNLIF